MQQRTLKFSGHESFHCRHFWLKKGFDYVKSGNSFNDKSGIELGVGKNMVASIRFWLQAFDLVDERGELTSVAKKIFDDNGWDPFLEDEATLWLLHYQLSSKNYSSLYNLIFTELRKVRPEFSSNHLLALVNEIDTKQSENIVAKDFSVFVHTYFAKKSKDKEESFSGLLTELNLLQEVGADELKNTIYHISNSKQDSIPWQVVLFCILENDNYGSSISLNELFNDQKGVGNLFAFTKEGLENKLTEIGENHPSVVYKNDAGVKELQFKEKLDGINILADYYEK